MNKNAIYIAIIIIVIYLLTRDKGVAGKSPAVSPELERLSGLWQGGEGPIKPEEKDLVAQLKELGYCAAYGGRGKGPIRYVVKNGEADEFGDVCNC